MTTLFISDLHLCDARPAVTDLFIHFLEGEARSAEALYILGDFFEYWIGDEAVDQPEFRPIVDALHDLTSAGTPTYMMHGNRDFLMGAGFARESGCQIIPDPTVIDLYGTPVLLMHGDRLCAEDIEYQEFRKMVRNPEWQKQFLTLPVFERDAIARNYREKSRESTSQKAPEIMDVTDAAVVEAFREHNVRHLIHGHTHRPREHAYKVDGTTARRIVLGDWYEQGSVLRCNKNEWVLESLPLQAAAAHQK